MKSNHAIEEARTRAEFDRLTEVLRDPKYLESLGRPLAFWTLGSDRRLPIALLDWSLQKIVQTPFEQLAKTPGVGQKKLGALVVLLGRAADDTVSMPVTTPEAEPALTTALGRPVGSDNRFDPDLVSEALWQQWQETIVRHGLADEKLGRLAPSLHSLPTVIWETTLRTYLGLTLSEIRQLPTHGEKRVKVVLEVFFVLHEMLCGAGLHPRLSLRPVPAFAVAMERWFEEMLSRDLLPSELDLRNGLTTPLVNQVENDIGSEVAKLVRGRLGLNGAAVSVRDQAQTMGVTRARIYQLLEDCARVMNVRWPEGRRWFEELTAKYEQEIAAGISREFFLAIRDVFYPSKFAQVAPSLLAD